MLRKEIRVFVFLSCSVLIVVLMYRSDLRQTSKNSVNLGRTQGRIKVSRANLHDDINLLSLQDYNADEQGALLSLEDHEGYGSLPDYVIRGVSRFVFIIGYRHSDHSIIASMLDAHPHIVISRDYSLFTKWREDPNSHCDKHWLFNALYSNSKNSSKSVQHQTSVDGYKLAIPGSWQGQYDSSMVVIGDNSGWTMANLFERNKQFFVDTYNRLKNTIQMPISIIRVIKNPYDNIAMLHLHKMNATGAHHSLETQIQDYFKQVHSEMAMINAIHLSVIDIHNSDMIAKPKIVIRTVCDGLQIPCSEQFLQMCAHKTFSSELKSRHWIKWTPYFINLVSERSRNYSHLKRYSFES